MKKVFAILSSVVFIASFLRVSIDSHFCYGNLAATKISLNGEKASCGMRTTDAYNSDQVSFDSKCCEDQMSFLTLNNNFLPEYFNVEKPFPVKHVMIFHNILLSEYGFLIPDSSNSVFPPGEYSPKWLTSPEICVFRI